jgi:hypothetical protein
MPLPTMNNFCILCRVMGIGVIMEMTGEPWASMNLEPFKKAG